MVKRALVVGCNYPGSPHQLSGCGNDASNVCSLLCEVFEYRRQDIVMMVDTDPQTTSPTGANVKAELHRVVDLTAPGDVLFFHYSGHGTQVPTDDSQETDGLDEAIVPTDFNIILDDDLRVIFCKVPLGAHFTMTADCCHSGTMLDHKLLRLPDKQNKLGHTNVVMQNKGVSVNKSLPYEGLLAELQRATGQQVCQGNVRYSLMQAFGPDSSLKAQAYLGMLGEAFREEVVANGGRLPAFSLSTIADIASRLWLMARAWNGRKNPQSKYGMPSAPQRYPARPNLLNPSAAPYPYPASFSSVAGLGPSFFPPQLLTGGHRQAGTAAMQPSFPDAYPTVPVHPHHRPSSSSLSHDNSDGRLNPNAASYYPPLTGVIDPYPPSYAPSSSSSPQQHSQQYIGVHPSNPMFSMQPLHGSTGYPNAVSCRIGHQSRVSGSAYLNTPAYPAQVPPQYSQHAAYGAYPTTSPQMAQDSPNEQIGSEVQQSSRVGHRYITESLMAQKIVVPMDWHMDILAGKAPDTFSPLGDQAASASFLPISEPLKADPERSSMGQSFDPVMIQVYHPSVGQSLDPGIGQGYSPGPKRYTQHAFRVSTQKFAQGDFSHLAQPRNPPDQLIAAGNPTQDYKTATFPDQGTQAAVNPNQVHMGAVNPNQVHMVAVNPNQGDIAMWPSQASAAPLQQHVGYVLNDSSMGAYPTQIAVVSQQSGQGCGSTTGQQQCVGYAPGTSNMGPYPTQATAVAQQSGQGPGSTPGYVTGSSNMGAYPNHGTALAQQGGQGFGGAAACTAGSQHANSLVGSNGRPRISGKAGSKPHPSNQLHRDVGVLISGCADAETSADTSDPAQPGRPYGAMTQALVSVVRQHYRDYPTTPLTNSVLVVKLRDVLGSGGFSQHPCLGCSKQNANLPFAL